MALSKAKPQRDLTALLLNGGLAASIAASASFLTDRFRAADDGALRRCEIARQFLSNGKPAPYVRPAEQAALAQFAARALARCLEEQ